jgi:hypothetical protein
MQTDRIGQIQAENPSPDAVDLNLVFKAHQNGATEFRFHLETHAAVGATELVRKIIDCRSCTAQTGKQIVVLTHKRHRLSY